MAKKFPKVLADEHVTPVMDNYLMKCCDCGLVHAMDFRAVKVTEHYETGEWAYKALDPAKYRILLRARRHEPEADAATQSKEGPI